MTPVEQAKFEQQLDNDPQLGQMLEEELLARTAVAASAYLDRKARLMSRPVQTDSSHRPLWGSPMLWAVAAAMAVLLAFWGIRQGSQPLTNEQLFAQNYQPAPFTSGVRGSDGDPFEMARNAYEEGDFSQAGSLLEELLADSSFSLRPKAGYFLGLCYMEMNEWEKAVNAFQEVASGSVYGPSAQWYLALTYLQIGKVSETKKALQQLLEGPVQSYQAQAKILLQSLDQ